MTELEFSTLKEIFNHALIKANTPNEFINGIIQSVYEQGQKDFVDEIKAEIEHIGKATPLIGTNTVIDIINKHIGGTE